jgi:hypothetical protein
MTHTEPTNPEPTSGHDPNQPPDDEVLTPATPGAQALPSAGEDEDGVKDAD